jgi:hypothetical protein
MSARVEDQYLPSKGDANLTKEMKQWDRNHAREEP